MNFELLKNISEVLLTPLIAVITINITFQQWKTNEKMRRQELFGLIHEKLYKPTVEMIETTKDRIFEKPTIDVVESMNSWEKYYASYKKFTYNIRDYSFLIAKEDEVKLQVYSKILYEVMTDIEATRDKKEKLSKISEYISRSNNDLNNIKIMFGKYLKFENQSWRNRLRIWYHTFFIHNCVLFFPTYYNFLYRFAQKIVQLWTDLCKTIFLFLTKRYSLKDSWQEISQKVFITRKSGDMQEPCTCKANSTSVNDVTDQTPDKSTISNT